MIEQYVVWLSRTILRRFYWRKAGYLIETLGVIGRYALVGAATLVGAVEVRSNSLYFDRTRSSFVHTNIKSTGEAKIKWPQQIPGILPHLTLASYFFDLSRTGRALRCRFNIGRASFCCQRNPSGARRDAWLG